MRSWTAGYGFFGCLICLTLVLAGTTIRAQDLSRLTAPAKWLDPFEPESLAPLTYPSYFTDLEKARAQAFAGRYKLCLLTLYKIKNPRESDLPDIALIKAGAQNALGEKEQALALLSDAKFASDQRIQVLRANILLELGRPTEAVALLKNVVHNHPDDIAGHYYLGSALENMGQISAASDAYKWFEPFIDRWQGEGTFGFSDAGELTLIGRGLDRWASLTSQYRTRDALNNIIYSMFVKAYDEMDRNYWPAHVAAAEYNLSHDDSAKALSELGMALQINPRDIHALALMGRILLSEFDFDGCERAISAIQEIDDSSIDAELLLCRDLLQEQRARQAIGPVQRILLRQPRHLEALGLLAAAQALQLHEREMTDVLKQVDQIDPGNASAYIEVAAQLAARRQYPRSAEMYKTALQRAPWRTDAYNGLGLLYTQSGDEEESFKILQQARLLDPYNVATTNYMRLLDDFHKFARKETEHFVIFYDAEQDPIIPEYFGDYLESIYAAVCGEYHTQLRFKTSIEVFPTHAQFSVRTTGSPWIGTVGASTGSIIALVAPRKGAQTMGSFNWAQVLRHEFTHTVTLTATDNRIAHWLTEGLAVMEEHAPLHWEWVPMLYQAVTQHQLFTMDNLTWGFVRPKRPQDRALAYAQSFWICQYIEATYGHDKILAMLEQFRLGKEQDEVFPMILGKSMDQFQADFFAWCEKQVATWGYDKASADKYQTLSTAGEAQIKNKNYQAAVNTWEEVVKLRPVDSMPHMRLAGLYLILDQRPQAIAQLDILNKVTIYDNKYALRIAGLYRDMKDWDHAVAYAQRAVYIDPYDLKAHKLLVELLETTGQDAKNLDREKRVVGILEARAEKARKAAEPPTTGE